MRTKVIARVTNAVASEKNMELPLTLGLPITSGVLKGKENMSSRRGVYAGAV